MRFLCALAFGLGLALPAPASPCGPYRLAFYSYGKLYFEDEQGRAGGIDKDIADELSRRSGCRFETTVESRVRIWDQLRRGQLHIALSGNPNEERESYAEFVPYAQTRYHVVMPRELAQRVPSMAAFRADPSLRLVVVKGFIHGPTIDAWINALRNEGRVSETADFSAVLRVIAHGRVHALLALPITWSEIDAALAERAPLAYLDWAPNDRALGSLVMSKTAVSARDRERLRQALRTMLADGTIRRILVRHVGTAAAAALIYRPDNIAPP